MLIRKRKNPLLKFISRLVLLCGLIVIAAVLVRSDITVGQIFLHETMPDYSFFLRSEPVESDNRHTVFFNEMELFIGHEQPSDEIIIDHDIIGLQDIVFQDEKIGRKAAEIPAMRDIISLANLPDMLDFDYLIRNFYIVPQETGLSESDFDIQHMLTADFSLSSGNIDEPQVLVFNTHSNEMFIDSKDRSEGVKALSIRLCQILNERYGIRAVYTTGDFDFVNGVPHVLGAYERMEPVITRLLEENPSIEVVIDIHRDGVAPDRHLITTIDGRPTAQLMFVNGMSRVNSGGNPVSVAHLPNPNLQDNLAFSFQMQLAAASLYPDSNLMRRIYLKPFRYSLHMLPRSLLVEVGAQTNTLEEALNAIDPLASMLAAVLGHGQ
ncbi:MAG: stage II sporulation protein P [Defluviitaleaceae bacterium]|nr:stage II sporulation protein P [Defluviitaleaceae bacterium]